MNLRKQHYSHTIKKCLSFYTHTHTPPSTWLLISGMVRVSCVCSSLPTVSGLFGSFKMEEPCQKNLNMRIRLSDLYPDLGSNRGGGGNHYVNH